MLSASGTGFQIKAFLFGGAIFIYTKISAGFAGNRKNYRLNTY